MSDLLTLPDTIEGFVPDPEEVAALADRLSRLYQIAVARRRYFNVRIRFEEGEVKEVQAYIAFPKVIRESGWAADGESFLAILGKAAARAERPIPLGWKFDEAALAEQLLRACAIEDQRLRTVTFRADFRRISNKKLFKCWVDAEHPAGKLLPTLLLAATESTSASAAVAEAVAIAEQKFTLEQLPPPELKKQKTPSGSKAWMPF